MTIARTREQQELIDKIRKDDPDRCAAAMLFEFEGNDLLICWHGHREDTDPYDLYVWQEFFPYNKDRVKWQADMLDTAKQYESLGHKSRGSYLQTYVCSYDLAITPEMIAVLRQYFGMVEPF